MPSFKYKAIDKEGKQVRGSIVAENAAAARKQLRNRMLHPKSIEQAAAARLEGSVSVSRRNKKLVMDFTTQLSTMINAEVKLTEALDLVILQVADMKFKQALQNIKDQLVAGDNFADGLKGYPQYFDTIYSSMVKVGEATGNLGSSLEVLKEQMLKSNKLEQKFISAMIYPAILVIGCIVIVSVIVTVAVPKLTKLLMATGKELPASTKALINLSSFMAQWWWLILICLFVTHLLFRKWKSTKSGRTRLDRFKLKIPVFGTFIKHTVVARFASTLAALMRSGMPMADALAVVADVTGNVVMGHAVHRARERIVGGADIATPLRDSGLVDPTTAHMITIGEKSGELETMLRNIAESMQEKTDIAAERIGAVIEPVIIVIMAVIIGMIFMAIVIPMMDVNTV